MAEEIARLGYKVDTTPLKKAETSLKNVTKAGKEAESGITEVSKSVGALGVAVAAFAAASMVSKLSSMTDANREFAKSVSELSAITGATGDDLLYYANMSKEIGASTTLSATQAAQAFKLMASAKPDLLANAEALNEVTQEAVALSEAAGIDLPAAASIVGTSLNQFGLSASSASDVVNILAASSKQGTASVASISESLVNAGSAAKTLNVSFTETVSALQALAKAGVDGAQAGTALNQVMLRLERSGNSELMPSVVGLESALRTLRDTNLSTTEMMTFFGDEAFKSAAALLGQLNTLSSLNKTLEGTRTAYEQAATNQNNWNGDLLKLDSTLESIAIRIGSDLDPALRSSTQSLNEMLSSTDAVVDGIEAGATVLGGVAAVAATRYAVAISGGVVASLAATPAVTAYNSALLKTVVVTEATTFATNALTVATRLLTGPIGIVVSALGVAAYAFSSSKAASDENAESMRKQAEAADALGESISGMSARKLQASMVSENERNLELLYKQADIQNEIDDVTNRSIDSIEDYAERARDIDLLNEALNKTQIELGGSTERLTMLRDEIAKLAKNPLDILSDDGSQGVATATKKYDEQSAAIAKLNDQIGMSADQLFIYNAMQNAAANDYTPAQTKAILEQAEAYIANKNAYESFQDSFGGQTEIGDDSFYNSLDMPGIDDIEDPFSQVTSGANEALGAIRTLSSEGSSEYAALGVAAQAVNTIQAIGAVLNQGSGDPYTAFGRMAAMATAVAALGVSVGSMSTGFDDESATNQAAQGLNVWGEKSESISNALETTADATSDLVGINTSMLDALTTLQDDLTSAAQLSLSDGLLDGADVSGSIIDNVYDLGSITGSGFVSAFEDSLKLLDFTTSLGITGWVTDWMGESLGGDSKVVDQGITLLGGTLSELIDGAVVEAYSKVDYTTWKFGSTKTKTLTEELDEASTQFALVFASLADSVSEGASTLGMSTADITAALSEFEIETQKISLKGLSAEEQEEEIEAVFSSIFDDLAGSVVPYLDDFQAVGESLGETLARVATEVAIADVLVDQLGVTLGDKLADPEAYTTIADNISTLVGGVEELASQTSDFVSSFAPESVMLEIYTDAMVEALDAIGLSLPDSTTGFWELMEGIDGTTEAGQEQIATLLSLTDTASEYYDLLEDNNDTFNSLTESLRDMVISMYDLDEATNTATLDMALAAARAGDFSLAEEFSGVTLSESDYGSAAEYAAATAVTANKIADLADLTESQVSIDERQVNLLDSINQNIIAGLTSLKDDLGGLMRTQNRIQAQAADSLDVINNKTEYAS